MKKILILIVILLCVFVTGCDDESIEMPDLDEEDFLVNLDDSIDGCELCVYSFYYEENKKILPNAVARTNYHTGKTDVFSDSDRKILVYESNYKVLIKDKKEDKRYFLGHVLDTNGNIARAFACGVEGDVSFCVEGRVDSSAYEKNKEKLLGIFGEYEEKGYRMGCSDNGIEFVCTGKNVEARLSKSSGGVSVGDSYRRSIASCTVYNDGYIYCND